MIQVLEGESSLPGECIAIGRTVVRDLPAGLPKGWPVEVTFEYGVNGPAGVRAWCRARIIRPNWSWNATWASRAQGLARWKSADRGRGRVRRLRGGRQDMPGDARHALDRAERSLGAGPCPAAASARPRPLPPTPSGLADLAAAAVDVPPLPAGAAAPMRPRSAAETAGRRLASSQRPSASAAAAALATGIGAHGRSADRFAPARGPRVRHAAVCDPLGPAPWPVPVVAPAAVRRSIAPLW